MKISFLGAAQTVTGSQHLLTTRHGQKILLDCGLYQGRPSDEARKNGSFDFDPAELDAVILSHAHIDHSGSLPALVKEGYEGPIYTSHVTMHLADVMMRDSAQIQEADAEIWNEKRAKKGGAKVEPRYTLADAVQAGKQLEHLPYNKPFEPVPGVEARLVEAGHILGSASVVLDVDEGGNTHRVWFSGDIGRLKLPLVRDPVLPSAADTLIMESTYGDRDHPDPELAYEELQQVLLRTFERGGKVIIPAFAVGRTQELVYSINLMIEDGSLPRIPVYVDSPLAVEASEIFRSHPQYFDEEAQEFALSDTDRSALGFDLLTYVHSVQESIALNDMNEPMVIISASGMAESGRILHHLRHNLGDPRATVLIVSYQAPNTLGRALASGEKQVMIFDDAIEVKAEVVNVRGFSAHADRNFLFEYGKAVKGQSEQIFLVHGEKPAADMLRERLQEAGLDKIYFPYMRQTMET